MPWNLFNLPIIDLLTGRLNIQHIPHAENLFTLLTCQSGSTLWAAVQYKQVPKGEMSTIEKQQQNREKK